MELWPCIEFHYTLLGSLKETFSRGQSSPAKLGSSVDFIPIKFHSDSLWNSSLHQINSTKWQLKAKRERKQTSTNQNHPLFDSVSWLKIGPVIQYHGGLSPHRERLIRGWLAAPSSSSDPSDHTSSASWHRPGSCGNLPESSQRDRWKKEPSTKVVC